MRTKTFLTTAMLLFVLFTINAQQTSKTTASLLNGAWQRDDNKGFTVIHDGYFNSVEEDSTGKWASVHAGSFTINSDNTVTFKLLYSSHPARVGSLNTAKYSINGETLTVHHFKKLVDREGKDITERMPKDAIQTMTRMK